MDTILVIDDEPTLRELYKAMLSRQGYRVSVAGNGVQGLLALEMVRPDLIVLDMAMPEMDGLSFLRVIRDSPEWKHIPVVLLTAFATSEQQMGLSELGVTEQLTKASFSVRDLRERVAKLLRPEAVLQAA